MKRKASELEAAGASLTEGVGHISLPQGPVAAVAVKKEESGGGADDNAAGGERPRLPRKKGPKPKRIRRITLKPLNEDEEDALLDNLNASIQDRPRNDDPILARMRRKLALRQVTSHAPPARTGLCVALTLVVVQLKRERDMRAWDLDMQMNNLLAQKRKQHYFDCHSDIPVRREPEYKKKLRRTISVPPSLSVARLLTHRDVPSPTRTAQ
jgi:hypothetical protein